MASGPLDRTLSFSVALLELTVRENGVAMDTLARVFAEMARLFDDVERRCDSLEAALPDDELAAVRDDCAAAAETLREGLRATQLHDITDQRLSHVATLLAALSDGRQCDIGAVLTDAEEHALLALIERGLSRDEACRQLSDDGPARGSVELF